MRKRLYTSVVAALGAALCVLPLRSVARPHLTEGTSLPCSVTVSAGAETAPRLTDGNLSTVWKARKNTVVQIHSDQPIGGVYILWNATPPTWSLRTKEQPEMPLLQGGKNGFLHEYQPVEEPTESVQLVLDGGKGAIAELIVLSEGTPPSWVQQWQPPCEKADLLLISTHADDEHLWFGGTLPVYAGERQKRVQVAYLMRHGAGRTHELLNGLWTVGVTAYPVISDFRDHWVGDLEHAKQVYNETEVIAFQTMLLRRFRPDVVVGHDENGEYGHGAHRLNAYTLEEALKISADAAQYPALAAQYGTWQVKKCYLHLYAQNPVVMDWNQPLAAFDGKTGLDMAKAGFACHASQVKIGRYQVKTGGKYDNSRFGLYFSAVGADVQKNDFFEHIDSGEPTGTTSTTTQTAPPETTAPLSTTSTTIEPPAPTEPTHGTQTITQSSREAALVIGQGNGTPPAASGRWIVLLVVYAVLLAGSGGLAWCLYRCQQSPQTAAAEPPESPSEPPSEETSEP